MERHARTKTVQLARLQIAQEVIRIADQHGLTFVETMQAIADVIEALSRDALRPERHPNDADKGADEA